MADKIRVLMVDDEDKFRETTAKILNRKGYTTTIAGTGEEAIEILRLAPQDVVILDIRMPGMDGHEALSEIRKAHPETQVIMLTGHGGEDSAKSSLDQGAYDYLSKPCDIDLLAAKINSAYAAMHQKKDVRAEKLAGDIMIHVADYTRISEDKTVSAAIVQLIRSFEGVIASNRVMETGHRSILVFDRGDELSGILSIQDLIEALRPGYLSAPKPSMADSMQYSPMFWTGLFTTQIKTFASIKVRDVMSASPPRVDENTNLMELANLMITQSIRRVVVTKNGVVTGVVREQELFFEMADIIRSV